MKMFLSVAMAAGLVAVLAGAALAHGPWAGGGRGPGMMGWHGGPGWMGGPGGVGAGGAGCPGFAGAPPGGGERQAAITEEKAREIGTAYVDQYLKGFVIERVLPFTGRMGTMYQLELKGPKGEQRLLHVNPWGNVRPFGPVAATE